MIAVFAQQLSHSLKNHNVHLTTAAKKIIKFSLVRCMLQLKIIITYNAKLGLHYNCKLRTTWTSCVDDNYTSMRLQSFPTIVQLYSN